MAAPANTLVRGTVVGIREDLREIMDNLTPDETPIYASIKKATAKQTFCEWQTDTLRAANKDNAALEGDDATNSAITQPNRIGNHTQIFQQTYGVAGTVDAITGAGIAGRASEMGRSRMKAMKEIKLDIEASITQNNAAVAGNTRKSMSLETAIALSTNYSHGVGGVTAAWTSGAATVAPTDGTQRAFTETLLKTVMGTAISAGFKTKILSLGAQQKQVFSSFPGIALNRVDLGRNKEQGIIIGAADMYVSDFGTLMVLVNLQQRNRTALLIDNEALEWAFLRPIARKEIASLGDNRREQMLTEGCLVVRNPAALAKVADLT